jgi:hypothetical protein
LNALARPGVFAAVLVSAALALHPATAARIPARAAVLASALALVALGLAVRAAAARDRRVPAALAAAGAAGLLGAAGVDGLRGHHGTLALAAGQSRGNFDETGPDGRRLGLRPLGFGVGAERVRADGSVDLMLPGRSGPVELTARRAVAAGGHRFADPRALPPTGGVARLRVAASDGVRTTTVDVSPGAPGRAGDLAIALEQYFPDFALDDRQQPFSRSAEPRNPGAVLSVERGGRAYRAFVLQAMPGVHRVEGLGLAFSLLDVEPERPVEIAVHREPAAPVALAGALLLCAGLGLRLRASAVPLPRADGTGGSVALLVTGAALAAFLGLVDGSSVLAWSFGLPAAAGRVPLPGTGVLLGATLLLVLGGSLLLLAERLAGPTAGATAVARAALRGAVALGTGGFALAVVRLAFLPAGTAVAWRSLLGLAVGIGVLAVALAAARPSPSAGLVRLAAGALPAAAWLALAGAIAVAAASVLRDGTYATEASAAAAATALLGLAALEPTAAGGVRRLAFLLAVLALATA